ncbi:hypothetical protein M2277_005644 [Paenibacillus sp. LBL]|uniref:hypothetical protein n=1 Tax=Paenibacillus sp. LBL TaxID=2940563 RepID=UPI00247709D5|nr:hypothetical protein [Paenibacillus sp. LBL]MDH6674945.1 hypothetical protein [Paenibacillus sp. LBL]
MRRISLITESSARPDEALPAYLFYQGSKNRWINAVIEYMEVRAFPRENIFFLSHYGQRIIGYEETVNPYPKQKYHPRAKEAAILADKVLDFILSMNPLPFVEIHTGRTWADPLKQLFDKHNISYRLFADGVSLGQKPSYYGVLIEEELDKRRLKDIQRERWNVSSLIRKQTPQEASEIITRFDKQARLYGIERNLEELKELLGGYKQKRKDEMKALRELENVVQEEDPSGVLSDFLQSQDSLADLHAHRDFEGIKNQFGKSMAKFTLYLIKRNYVTLMENRISEALLRTQIALIK